MLLDEEMVVLLTFAEGSTDCADEPRPIADQ